MSAVTTMALGPRRTHLIGVLCALTLIIMYSGFTLISRLGFTTSLRPADIAALRFGIAGACLAPVLYRYGLAGVRWRDAALLALSGGMGFAMLAYTGLSLAPASHGTSLMHGTLPLFTFALSWWITSEPVTRRRRIGLTGILVGIGLMAWDSVATSTPSQLLGDLALLSASASWSAYGLLARRVGLAPLHATSIVAVFSMVCYLPLYALFSDHAVIRAPLNELLLQGVFQGVVIGVVSVSVYLRAVAALGAVETALFSAAVPGVTTIGAIFLLGEVPSAMAVAGVIIVTTGTIVSLTGQTAS